MQLKYKKVDAFTENNSLGNPAAFLLLDQELTPKEYLAIAKEHAGFVSEFVYCCPSEAADVKLTYYSSECEVEFCGHGTIATMYEWIRSNPAFYAKEEVKIETNRKGILTVKNRIQSENAVYITAPKAQFLNVPVTREQIVQALQVDAQTLSRQYEVDFIDAGLRTLLVPIATLQQEISMFPNVEQLKEFCYAFGIDIILIFSIETEDPDAFAHTRVFAPKFGYLEDPATGSGNSAFANYLIRNNLWNGDAISVEQGGENIIYNRVKLCRVGDDILFGGGATLRIEGSYYL